MTMVHDGKRWLARNGTIEASGSTLEELDENLKALIISNDKYKHATSVTVFMGFDYSTIPTWIRQYHTHYFNRYVTFDL